MQDGFIITYTKGEHPKEATLQENCDDRSLGIGLKDLCLYIKNNRGAFSDSEKKIGTLQIFWNSSVNAGSYRDLSAEQIISKLKKMQNALMPSESIEHKMGVSDFILEGINDNINKLLLLLEEKGKEEAEKKMEKELNYLFQSIGKKLIPQNDLKVDQKGITFSEAKHILSELYHQIPQKTKDKFPYRIDFEGLVYDDLDVVD